MKPTLEAQRQALLAHIEASRAVYRRLLSDASPSTSNSTRDPAKSEAIGQKNIGIKRRSMQWAMEHPLAVAAGITLLVWAAPRCWALRHRGRTGVSHASRTASPWPPGHERQQAYRDLLTEATGRALLSAATLLMRNPATLRTLSRGASAVRQWMLQGRTPRSDSSDAA